MVHFRSLFISIISLVLLLTIIDASQHRSVRQVTNDVCPNLNGNACSFVECENGGQCIEDPTTTDCFKCQCTVSYTGKRCETPAAILPPGCNPGCQNNGACNINVCVCPVGFTGLLCETRNYCLPNNPCQHGGRCISTASDYVCDCAGTGYTGNICATLLPTNPCTSNPCQNNGQCSWNGEKMNCLCVNGYTGIFCQILPISCVTTPCENGGTCQLISANTYGCVCPAEFTGTQCETSIFANHPCVVTPDVCLNGGTCTVNGPGYLCKCPVGWSGTNCQIKTTSSSCNPSPCGIHGVCLEINIPSGLIAYCNCEDRWTGRYCDINMDVSCPADYCSNRGVCQINGNVPYCVCSAGYTGQRCEFLVGPLITTTTASTTTMSTSTIVPDVGSCLSNPCLNGGTCFGNSNSYICICEVPWSGPTCAIYIATTTDTTIATITTTTTMTTSINVCSPNPCYNGGTCYPSSTTFMCFCMPPYIGTWCEMMETTTVPLLTTTGGSMTCADQPCNNGGTCVPIGTSYSCFCGTSSIYTGKNCDSTTPMPVDECPLSCAPGRCIFSGNPQKPYACLWNGIMRPIDGTTG